MMTKNPVDLFWALLFHFTRVTMREDAELHCLYPSSGRYYTKRGENTFPT